MLNVVWRQMAARPGRTALTALSLVVAVAAVVSTTVVASATLRAYQAIYVALTGRADLEVVAAAGGSFNAAVQAELGRTPGVQHTWAAIERPTILYWRGRRTKLFAHGIDFANPEARQPYRLDAGRLPTGSQQVLIERTLAEQLGIEVDEPVRLLTRKGLRRLRVSGLYSPASGAAGHPGGMILLDLGAAQNFFARPREVDAIELVLAADADVNRVTQSITELLPPGLRVRRPAARNELARETLRATEVGLWFVSALILEVVGILVLHTFFMNVSERRQQLAVLRIIGATRRQIVGLHLAEALLLGTAGGLLGLAAGLGGGYLVSRGTENLLQLSLPTMAVSGTSLLAAAVTGPLLAILGSLIPALQAGRVSPAESLRAAAVAAGPGNNRPAAWAAACLSACSGACFALYYFFGFPPTAVVAAGALALVAAIFLLAALLVQLVACVRFCGRWLWGPEGELACHQLVRRRGRTVLTVGVLFLALSSSIGIANALINEVHDARSWFRRTMVADFFVRLSFPDPATGLATVMPEQLGDEIARLAGIRRVENVRFVSARAEDQAVVVIVREYSQGDAPPLDLQHGDSAEVRARLAAGEVVIGTALGQRLGKQRGDQLTLATASGPRSLRIAGIANEYTVGGLVVCIDRQVAQAWLDVDGADAFLIAADPRQLAAAHDALAEFCRRHGLLLHSFAEFSRLFDGMTEGIVAALWGLLILAIGVAVFGVVNTLAMNVLEQTREIGLLRAVAMTRRQVSKTIVLQAAVMGVLALVPGAAAGVAIAALINLCTLPMLGHQVQLAIHPELVIGALLLAIVAVLGTALGPARRAARMNLVSALQYQ